MQTIKDESSFIYFQGCFFTWLVRESSICQRRQRALPTERATLTLDSDYLVNRVSEKCYKNFLTQYCAFNYSSSSFKGGEPVLLSSGIHSFPFKLGLPLGLPSTFLGKHGWVQYFCKAAMREDSGLTHKNQQVFIIMNPIDLNLEPPILAVRNSRSLLVKTECVLNILLILATIPLRNRA